MTSGSKIDLLNFLLSLQIYRARYYGKFWEGSYVSLRHISTDRPIFIAVSRNERNEAESSAFDITSRDGLIIR